MLSSLGQGLTCFYRICHHSMICSFQLGEPPGGIEAPVWKESRFLHGLFGRRFWRPLSPWFYRSCFRVSSKLTIEADPSMCLMPELTVAFIQWMTPQVRLRFLLAEFWGRLWFFEKMVGWERLWQRPRPK